MLSTVYSEFGLPINFAGLFTSVASYVVRNLRQYQSIVVLSRSSLLGLGNAMLCPYFGGSPQYMSTGFERETSGRPISTGNQCLLSAIIIISRFFFVITWYYHLTLVI